VRLHSHSALAWTPARVKPFCVSRSDYGLKVIDATRINTGAAFDFYARLMTVKSLSDVFELATAHAREFEAVTAQSKELAAHEKGHDRDLEADDGKLDQDAHEGGLNFIVHRASRLSNCCDDAICARRRSVDFLTMCDD